MRSGQPSATYDSLGDSTAPTLSAIGASSTTDVATTLAATSNEAATGYWIAVAQGSTAPTPAQVKVGANYGAVIVVANGNGAMTAATSKNFSVSGLTASTAYTLYVIADDGSGNLSTAGSVAVTTSAAPDATAPTLSAVGVSGTTHAATTLAATSNEAATGYWIAVVQGSAAPTPAQVKAGVGYGAVSVIASGSAAMTAAMPKSFAVGGLAASTAYTLYVVAEDGSGNLSAESSAHVTTSAAPDVTAPTMSAVGVSGTTASGTTLAATSNEVATGYWIAVAQGSAVPTPAQVKAGATYGAVTVVASGNAAMTAATPKSFAVGGLVASTAYMLYVVAEDGSGNLSTASGTSVTTSATPDVTPPSLSAVGVSGTTSSATTLAATSNEAATGYWVVLSGNGATVPAATQVKLGQTSTGAAAVRSGNGAMASGVATQFAITSLAAATAYTVCIMAEDGAGNLSAVSCADLDTGATAASGSCGGANGAASVGAPTIGLCATGSPSVVTSSAGSHAWNCAGTGGGTTAACTAPRAYTVSPFASTGGSLSPATAQAVTFGGTQSFSVLPAAGFQLVAISGCGGTLLGSTFTTAPIAGNCTVAANFSAPTPPTPPTSEPPLPSATTMPSGGARLTLAVGTRIEISDNGAEGSALTLNGRGRTLVAMGSGTLTLETAGETRLTVVRATNQHLGLRLDTGYVIVGGDAGQVLATVGGHPIAGLSSGTRARARYDGGRLLMLEILAGGARLPGGAFASVDDRLLGGETAEFTNDGRMTLRRLGSLDRNAGLLGDALSMAPPSYVLGVPRLSTGIPERQRIDGQTQTLDRQLTTLLQPFGLISQGQDSQGVIRLSGADGALLAALPLGEVRVADGEANGLRFNADGSARAVVNGFIVLLVPTVADPTGLAGAFAARQPGTRCEVGGEGEWRILEPEGRITVLRPGWHFALASGAAGLHTSPDGRYYFAHDSLFGSVLHPAIADRDGLLATARQLDPAATLVSVAGGDTVLTLNGGRFTLHPDPVLVDIPAQRAIARSWQDGSRVYIPVAGHDKAQGFVVR